MIPMEIQKVLSGVKISKCSVSDNENIGLPEIYCTEPNTCFSMNLLLMKFIPEM